MADTPQSSVPQEIEGSVSERTRDELLMWLAEGCSLPQASAMVLSRIEAEKGTVSIDQLPGFSDGSEDEAVLRIAAETSEQELSKLKGVPGALRAWGSSTRAEGSREYVATRASIEIGRRAARANRSLVQLVQGGATLLIAAAMPVAAWWIVRQIHPAFFERLESTFQDLQKIQGDVPSAWLYSLLPLAEALWPALIALYVAMIGACILALAWVRRWARLETARRAGAAEAAGLVLLELARGDEFPAAASTVATMLDKSHVARPLLEALEAGDPSRFLGRGLLLAEAAELASAGAKSEDVTAWLQRRLVLESQETGPSLEAHHMAFAHVLLLLASGFLLVLAGIFLSAYASYLVMARFVTAV